MKGETESTLYMNSYEDKEQFIVSIYIDELFNTNGNPYLVHQFKQLLMKEFVMFDLGEMCYFLGNES